MNKPVVCIGVLNFSDCISSLAEGFSVHKGLAFQMESVENLCTGSKLMMAPFPIPSGIHWCMCGSYSCRHFYYQLLEGSPLFRTCGFRTNLCPYGKSNQVLGLCSEGLQESSEEKQRQEEWKIPLYTSMVGSYKMKAEGRLDLHLTIN